MKVIAYSIFGNPKDFEFKFYMRGLYFNIRMNRLIYPEWTTWVMMENNVYEKYENFFLLLNGKFGVKLFRAGTGQLCEMMLWRMWPLFFELPITHVLCRDADAITTYKEAQAVQEWIDSGLGFHGITDNPAHSLPMMGGMIGFRTDHFRQTFPQYKSLEDLTKRWNLTQRGSDQSLLMSDIYPKAKDNMMGHFFDGCREKVKITTRSVQNQIPGVDPKLWESNLCAFFIGAAGVNDFETLRFFKRFDKTDYSDFEKEHSDICYWAKN